MYKAKFVVLHGNYETSRHQFGVLDISYILHNELLYVSTFYFDNNNNNKMMMMMMILASVSPVVWGKNSCKLKR